MDFSTASVKQTSDFFMYLYQDLNRRRENSVDFSTLSVKQISDFFMYLYQDLNRHPSTIDGYRTTIVDTLCPSGQHIAHNEDLHRLLSRFHRVPPSGTFLFFSMSSQKHPLKAKSMPGLQTKCLG